MTAVVRRRGGALLSGLLMIVSTIARYDVYLYRQENASERQLDFIACPVCRHTLLIPRASRWQAYIGSNSEFRPTLNMLTVLIRISPTLEVVIAHGLYF